MSALLYFAYGSNMSLARLQARVPAARHAGCARPPAHTPKFHKLGDDGSAKLDAVPSDAQGDAVLGVLYRMSAQDKAVLDPIEGRGYEVVEVAVESMSDGPVKAFMYRALRIDPDARPFAWYVNHVLVGARAAGLPDAYVAAIAATPSIDDPDPARDARERAIHPGSA